MWQFIADLVIGLVRSYMLSKPSLPDVEPAGLDELTVPTAQAGREIPVVFGTRDIQSPNVVWYGDLRTTPIKSEGSKK